MTYDELLAGAMELEQQRKEKNVMLGNARIISFLLDHCEIYVPEESYFVVTTNLNSDQNRIMRKIMSARLKALPDFKTETVRHGVESFAYSGKPDFYHNAPDWEAIMQLGLVGLKQRIANRTGRAVNGDFVEATTMVLEATQRFALRSAQAAREAGREQMADGLENLANNPPRNLYEAFQMSLLFYTVQQYFETANIRTLGRMDHLTMPFAQKEEPAYVQQLADRFLVEMDSYNAGANLPFALGGSDENGHSAINAMSYVMLNAYKKTMLPNVKLHILCAEDIPEDFLLSCMDSIKHGGNSIVFINDPLVVRGLMKLGMDEEDARHYDILGCYEPGARGECPGVGSSSITLPKAVEYALHGGKDVLTGYPVGADIEPDFATFEQFYDAVKANLKVLADSVMLLTSTAEARNPLWLASPFFSATMQECVERGGDAFANNANRYNNTSICLYGIGTLADSVYAVWHLVYEKKMLTLAQLTEILDSNWKDQESLRLYIRNKLPKYGNADPRVDDFAVDIANYMASLINGAPNARGGVYRMGIFSITQRIVCGEHTAATPDGRCCGETLSQNASATFGADRQGPTSHIISVTRLPAEDGINGTVLDMELHSSAASGTDGAHVLLATVKTFLHKGGHSVNYNVLDTETLKDAQLHPENHQNLQVRVSGWNAQFTKMDKQEQDEYILRSQMHLQ